MFDQLNLYLFALINSAPGLDGWRLHGAVFAAEWVIMILPLGLFHFDDNNNLVFEEAEAPKE